MPTLRIVVEPHAPDHLKQVVEDGLGSYNVAVTGFAEYYPVAIFLKDAHDAVLGGVLGHIWGKWLRVAILWLAEPVRGQGYGRQLLLAAEAYARERGCEQVQLSTFSFQARPFYEKLGYDVFATLEDCPPGHREYFLRKPLAEGHEPPSPEKGTA
jgi:GNAT superfamily N-acetyltransferase